MLDGSRNPNFGCIVRFSSTYTPIPNGPVPMQFEDMYLGYKISGFGIKHSSHKPPHFS